ncbi:MAG: GGDEF domain-containing protein [Ruminococcus sp.]|nr:GGDEF domain-containing protein [Ruminococcus sp.]
MSKRSIRPSLKNIRRLELSMIIGYAVIVVTAIAIVSNLAVRKTDEVLKSKVISLSSSLNVQMQLNVDSYLARLETIGTLAFGAEEAYTYDATDPNNDEYEAIGTEKAISDKLFSLCIMDNFVDYGIVYRNDRTIGKISNGTASLFGDRIFTELSSMITHERTHDGWAAGYNGDFKRIYYVKKIHENALLVASVYASELQSVFDNPEALRDMDIRLVNKDHSIIFSEDRTEVGQPLPADIMELVGSQTDATVMNSEHLVSVNSCGDDWLVISSIPTKIVLAEKNEMRYYIYMVALAAAVLAALVGAYLSVMLTDPVKEVVANLDTKAHSDQLTGILNKQSFEDYAQQRIETSLSIEKHAVIILDIDNFKGVNDTLGHAYGDKVLAKTGSTLRAIFSTDDLLGRIGGDEFCVLLNTSPEEGVPYIDYVKEKCEELCSVFRTNYTGDNGDYKISASVGVSLFPEHGSSYSELYKCADLALYRSKGAGKDTFTIFDPSMDEEVSQ